MGIVPGMPHMAFLSFAVLTGCAAYFIFKRNEAKRAKALEQVKTGPRKEPKESLRNLAGTMCIMLTLSVLKWVTV